MLDSSQKNKPTAFIGFGELALQLMNFLSLSEDNVSIFDDHLLGKKQNVSAFADYSKYLDQYHWVIALGYRHLAKKLELIAEIMNHGGSLTKFIHPSSFISEHAEVKDGSFIYPMCNLDKGVIIGEGSLINNSVIVSHDSTIGKACYLSPGVTISGKVSIGDATFIGAGTVVSNGVKIGDNVIVGAGSVITKDVPSNSNVIGNPMVFKNKIQLD